MRGSASHFHSQGHPICENNSSSLFLLLSIVLLAGCGKKATPAPQPTTPPQSEQATPVEWLDDLLPGLSNAYSLINPVGGHGQLSLDVDDACIAGIFTSYLNDPTSEPDASCLKDETLPY